MQYGNRYRKENSIGFSIRFKSYYVVWKPEAISQAEARQKGLNRTMQYGNFFVANAGRIIPIV